MKRYALLITFSLSLSLVLPFAFGGRAVIDQLVHVPLWLIATVLGMVLLAWCCNAQRLRLLVEGVGTPLHFGSALANTIATEFASVASPAGAGGPLAYIYLLGRRGVRTAHATALYVIDHVLDLIFFAIAIPTALVLFSVRHEFEHPVMLLVLALGGLITGAALLWLALYRYRKIFNHFGRLLRPLSLSSRRRRRLARWLIQFRHGVALAVRLPRGRLLLLLMYCGAHWLMRYSILFVVLTGLGHDVPWSYLFAVQSLLFTAGQISMLPGGSGSVEVGFGVLLAPYLATSELALALLTWRFATFYWYLLAGAPVFVIMTGSARGPLLTRGPRTQDNLR